MSRRFRRPFANFTGERKNELAELLMISGLAEFRDQRVALCKKINVRTESIYFFDNDKQTFCITLVFHLADRGLQAALLALCREIRGQVGEGYGEALDSIQASLQDSS